MAPLSTTSPEAPVQEGRLLTSLLGLYAAQRRLYGEVLELSRRQLALVRDGAPLGEIRGVLAAKRARLETIGRLDGERNHDREAWRLGRHRWSPDGRAQLHHALGEVGRVIEEILACEEENDRALLHQGR
jgi:hypothetical protein